MKKTPRSNEKRGPDPSLAYRLKRPLSWWRHKVFQKVEAVDLPRFRKALETASKGKVDSDLIRRALQNGDEALRVSLELHPIAAPPSDETMDLAISWAVMAVSLGKKVAALLVAEAMRQHLERLDTNPWRQPPDAADIMRMRRRLHGWFDICPINNLFFEARDGTALLGRAVSKVGLENGYSIVPVDAIPEGGRWGKEIAQRYNGLTRPLTLKVPLLPPDHLELALNHEMPSFSSVAAAVADDLRLQSAGNLPIARFRPLLLLGKPGIGKTRFARRLASLLGVPFRMIAAAGAQTPDLTGLTRIYDSTQAGLIPRTMLETGVANPIILVDEIDKARSLGREARLQDALLPMIDSETAPQVPDECLSSTVNMAHVSWILTANEIGNLSSPLLDRVRIFDVLAPDIEHLPIIIHGMLEDIARDFSIPSGSLPELPPETIQELLTVYRRGASIRAIKRAVIAAVSVSTRTTPDH